jgi:DNA topoisomerase-3
MSKTLIIAEKPSLERKIKDMLEGKFGEKFQKNQGYWESGKYLLSSFFGHLLKRDNPDEYGYKEWKAEDLPIIPEPFKFHYDGDKESRGKMLSKLARGCSMLVNCCDPDREGEGIFRTWYEFEGIRVPFKRFWSKSLAQNDLGKNWSKLKDSSEFDNLAIAQKLRSEADWLIGMNGSRAYAIAGDARLSIGRVQTATLSLIVKRDLEVENFSESFYYSLVGQWNFLPFIYFDETGTKFENEQSLNAIKAESERSVFHLEKFDEQRKTQNPPLPFSLHDLQKVANAKFGFALDKTLDIAQSLYEKELITYPRTSSPFLPPADQDTYYEVINKFADQAEKDLLIPKGRAVACIQESEASHTAIVPTGEAPQGLSDDEKKVFLLILNRFIVAFLKPRIYTQYSINITNEKHHFRSTVNKTIDPGFTSLNREMDDDGQESDSEEKDITINLSKESLLTAKHFEKLELLLKKRSKPKYYTPGTLVTAMIHCGKTVQNKQYKDILNEVEGLGTEATRDKVPVELENRGYIEKSGKYLKSTVKGRQLIAWVKPEVKTPELTAEWENKLRSIEKGTYDPAKFRSEIREFTRQIVVIDNNLKSNFTSAINESKRKCPKCNNPLTENHAGFFCKEECGFKLWKTMWEKKLSEKDIEALFATGKTGMIDGFKKREGGGTYSACVVMGGPEFKAKVLYESPTEYKCPLCGGAMVAFGVNLKCNKCNFSIWINKKEKKLSQSIIETLITKGRTPVIKGFISARNGKPFAAALVINKDTKKVDFEFQSKENGK